METFNNPVPMMSKTAVNFIESKLLHQTSNVKYIYEYGSGTSTIYFLDKLKECCFNYNAVERSPQWFEKVRKHLGAELKSEIFWGRSAFINFLRSAGQERYYVPSDCKRLPKFQRSFRRQLKALASSKFLKTYGQKFANLQFTNGSEFNYYYIYEGFKDQYGESPNKHIYINWPIENLISCPPADNKVDLYIIIDGGPRADIVERWYAFSKSYPQINVQLFLLEAGRGFYQPIIKSIGGQFISAKENSLIDGRPYLDKTKAFKSNITNNTVLMGGYDLSYSLNTELWYYSSK